MKRENYSVMIYYQKQYLIVPQFFFLLLSLPFVGILFHPESGGCFSAGTSDSSRQPERLLTAGWKFLFIGDDTSTHYVHAAVTDSAVAVTVPHTFPCDGPNGTPLEGYGWYFRTVQAPDSLSGKELFLHFEGVCLYADVFVNGRIACSSAFAYMPFSVNLTPFIEKSETIQIAVRIDSRLRQHRIPDDKAKGWWIYGGLAREVSLVVRPINRIDRVAITTTYRRKEKFELHCRLTPVPENPWDSVALAVKAPEKKKPLVKVTLKGNDTTVTIRGVRPWTPGDPYRYIAALTPFFGTTAGESITLKRGFCQLTVQGNKLLLNGAPFYIRGMARHDVRGHDGKPLTRQQRRDDLVDIKNMGVNFLRIAHFPQHRDVYELCDSLGLLVMDEIPAWKTDPKYLSTESAREYGAAYMRDLIDRHGNYSCIGVWSVGNQFKSYKTSVADYVKAVASTVKKSDPNRLVTFCSYYYLWDKAFRYVDIIAINEYFGWELASLDMLPPLLDKIHKEWPDKPVVVTEIGAQAKYGLHNAEAELAGPVKSMLGKDISEDHQALYLGAHMDTIWSRRRYVRGVVVWAYADYMANLNKKRTPDMPFGINSCGVVTADRKRKRSYQAVKERFLSYYDQLKGNGATAHGTTN